MISTSRAPSLDPFASVRTSRFESKETDRLTRARARLSYVESGFGYGWCVRSVATVSTSCVETRPIPA